MSDQGDKDKKDRSPYNTRGARKINYKEPDLRRNAQINAQLERLKLEPVDAEESGYLSANQSTFDNSIDSTANISLEYLSAEEDEEEEAEEINETIRNITITDDTVPEPNRIPVIPQIVVDPVPPTLQQEIIMAEQQAEAERREKNKARSAIINIIKDVTSGIEDFEKAGIETFIEDCKRAKFDLNEDQLERELTRAITRTKLSAQTRKKIRAPPEGYATLNDLLKALKKVTRGAKTETQLIGEVGLIRQGNSELVSEFGSRVRELGIQINDSHVPKEGEILEHWNGQLDRILQQSFYLGLKPTLSRQMVKGNSFENDIETAIALEEIDQMRDTVWVKKTEKVNMVSQQKSAVEVAKQKSERKCENCKMSNHTTEQCFSNKKRESVNNRSANNEVRCYRCDGKGHIAKVCPSVDTRRSNAQNAQRSDRNQDQVTCQLCHKAGHTADKCYKSGRQNENSGRSVTCNYCKRPGHLEHQCYAKQREIPGNSQRAFTPRGSEGPNNRQTNSAQKRVNTAEMIEEDEEMSE